MKCSSPFPKPDWSLLAEPSRFRLTTRRSYHATPSQLYLLPFTSKRLGATGYGFPSLGHSASIIRYLAARGRQTGLADTGRHWRCGICGLWRSTSRRLALALRWGVVVSCECVAILGEGAASSFSGFSSVNSAYIAKIQSV
jgi:hypothetical protein